MDHQKPFVSRYILNHMKTASEKMTILGKRIFTNDEMTVHAGTLEVKEIVMDFEMAAWRAAAHVMPEVECKGCAFHWGQAVWRKAQDIGLRQGYLEDNSTYTYVRKLMALSLLPGEHVTLIFRVLEG